MKTVINEPSIVQNINDEYYKLINYYQNLKRSANFIKYYNLNMNLSPKKEITNETYDFYTKVQNRWDIYDLTPMQIVAAIQNSPENHVDLRGNMIVSATTILIYTIDNPRIGDLVTFYKPTESKEVLRVVNVRLQLNSIYSSTPVKWYELDLETAPITYENLDSLMKNDHFIYDLSIEKNIEYTKYKKYVKIIQKLNNLLEIFNQFYLSEKDLYIKDNYILCDLNELIYFIKQKFANKYKRLFENIKSPFGYWDHFKFNYNSIEEMQFNKTKNFYLKDFLTHKTLIYNLPSRADNDDLNNLLLKVSDLLDYIHQIGAYIEYE